MRDYGHCVEGGRISSRRKVPPSPIGRPRGGGSGDGVDGNTDVGSRWCGCRGGGLSESFGVSSSPSSEVVSPSIEGLG